MWTASQRWIWLGTVLVAGWHVWRAYRGGASRRWRWGAGLLLGGVLLYPFLVGGVSAVVTWLYTAGPSSLAARLMPSRDVLPLAHYRQQAARLLHTALMALAAAAVAGLLPGVIEGASWRAVWARVWHHPARRALSWTLGGLLLVFAGYNLWLHIQFVRPHPVFYTGCRKIWGHRGHAEPPTILPNTVASYARAFDLGAAGVEMDVRYDLQRGVYFIGRYDEAVPPPDQRLTLEEVFAAVGTRGYFWLDIKTVAYLTPEQAQQAAHDLAVLLDRYDLRERAIVESDTPSNLVHFARSGLHTSYWIFNVDESEFPTTPWAQWWALAQIKRRYAQGGFSAISLDHRFYTPLVAWMLRGARVHLFTINDEATLRRWTRSDQVRVILTDTAHYDITACP